MVIPSQAVIVGKSPNNQNPKNVAPMISRYWNGAKTFASIDFEANIKMKCPIVAIKPIRRRSTHSKSFGIVILKMGISKIRSYCEKNGIIYDVKNIFNKKYTDLRL